MTASTPMRDEIYQIKLDDIFEGPMDLLVHLIKKNEVDIYDIPIAVITKQYLEYIEWMKSMNVDLAGDFLVMAATLTHIKSRMLLPASEDESDEEDPRTEITRPLLEYLQMKSAAEDLANRNLLGDNVFSRNPNLDKYLTNPNDQMITVGLFELIDAFQKILKRTSSGQAIDLTADLISVKDKISQIVDILEKKGSLTFNELFTADAGKSEIIVTFLAILEMVKLYLLRIAQHTQSGIIRIFYL